MAKAENLITSDVVEIDAPASVVWQILIDLDSYASWNPFTVKIESTLEMGEPVHLHVPLPGSDEIMVYVEHLCAFEPEKLLSWEKRATPDNKQAARRDQYIEAIDDNRCRYYHTDILLGIYEDQIMAQSGAWIKSSFDAVAHALKKHAEAVYQAQLQTS